MSTIWDSLKILSDSTRLRLLALLFKEELSVALNRSQAPMARHTHEERFMFDRDFSFHRECEEFAGCVLRDEDIKVGDIKDAERLMRVITKIYDDANAAGPLPA